MSVVCVRAAVKRVENTELCVQQIARANTQNECAEHTQHMPHTHHDGKARGDGVWARHVVCLAVFVCACLVSLLTTTSVCEMNVASQHCYVARRACHSDVSDSCGTSTLPWASLSPSDNNKITLIYLHHPKAFWGVGHAVFHCAFCHSTHRMNKQLFKV